MCRFPFPCDAEMLIPQWSEFEPWLHRIGFFTFKLITTGPEVLVKKNEFYVVN